MRGFLILFIAAIAVSGCASQPRSATDPHLIAEAWSAPEYQETLKGVDYYFGDQPHPAVEKTFGTRSTSRRSNATVNGSEFACKRAFVSALARLKRAALAVGGNAVINIKSNYKHREVSSATHYQCRHGALMSGVALKGDLVKVKK